MGRIVKKLFLLITALTMLSACNEETHCTLVCTDVYTVRDHWESFPISVYTTNEAQNTVLEYYNEALDETVFSPTDDIDEAQVIIDGSQPVNDGTDAFVSYAATNNQEPEFDGIITGSDVFIDVSLDETSLFYKKILAHELGHVLGAQHFCGTIMTPCAGDDAGDDIIADIKSPLFLEWFTAVYSD